jgi:hypothetical protein
MRGSALRYEGKAKGNNHGFHGLTQNFSHRVQRRIPKIVRYSFVHRWDLKEGFFESLLMLPEAIRKLKIK